MIDKVKIAMKTFWAVNEIQVGKLSIALRLFNS